MRVSKHGALLVKDGDGADRRTRSSAPFQRQSDKPEFPFADERLQIAEALDMGDVEIEAGLVHQRVHDTHGAGAHGINAEMDYSLLRQPFRGSDIDPWIVG